MPDNCVTWLIIDSKTAKDEKGGEEWMGGRGITKDGPLGNQKAAEKGIRLKEWGAVDGEDVNIGGFGYLLCEATCVLGANVLMCVT